MTVDSNVEVVVFDLGGVVCKFDPTARLVALAAASGLEMAEIQAAVWDSGLDAALDRGERSLTDAIAAVISALDSRISEPALLAAWTKAFVVDPAMIELANSLDRRAAMLTNNGPLLEACLRRGQLVLGESFDPILFSGSLGATKPDPLAYARAAARLRQRPASLLLVDDAAANVAGALQSGWQAIRYENPERLRAQLAAVGISS